MNILLVTSPVVSLREPFAGGTEAFVVRFANGLAQNDHAVDVICKDADEDNLFNTVSLEESALRMSDAITTEASGQKLYQSVQFALLDTSHYDVVHFHSYLSTLYEYGTVHQRKNIVTLHSPVTERLAATHALHRQRTDDIYVAVSQRLRDEWSFHIGEGIFTICNGIDISHYNTFEVCPKGEEYILWSGRICPEKDVVRAIRLATGINMPLLIAGPISDTNYYQTYVKPLLNANVKYIGHLSQNTLKRYLSGAKVLLTTSSWNEPFGLATLEALASDTPVIGFSTSIPPELRCSPFTQVIPSTSELGFCEALKTSQHIPYGSCRRFAGQFNLAKTISEYEKLYASL